MIIVAGHLKVRPENREQLVERSAQSVRLAREAEGCLDFAVAPDPIDPGRVNIFERWSDCETLLNFRNSGPDQDLSELILSFEVNEYEVNRPD